MAWLTQSNSSVQNVKKCTNGKNVWSTDHRKPLNFQSFSTDLNMFTLENPPKDAMTWRKKKAPTQYNANKHRQKRQPEKSRNANMKY